MGQTLSHGVYLPNEGERNCYAGLASNWQILNTAVGAIAEKAPLVHTHTVSQITDFPAYGTTAGTICEGNDSRLSDARTPVAHTHTKSDVTDLFNSANTWTSINTSQREICISGDRDAYIAPMWEGASSGIAFLNSDATKPFVFGQYTTDANNRKTIDGTKGRLLIRTGERNGETVLDFEPRAANAILGTSTNKWKTLNGINPGALSFPDYNRFEPIDFSKWDVNLGWDNLYTPSEDGWLYAEINDAATNSIYLYSSGLQPVQSVNRKYGISAQGNGSQSGYGGRLAIMIPVRKDIQYRFLIKASTVSDIYAVTFYPCLGNV